VLAGAGFREIRTVMTVATLYVITAVR